MKDIDKIRLLVREAFINERTLFKNFKHLQDKSSDFSSNSSSSSSKDWSSHVIFDKSKANKIEGLKKQALQLAIGYGAKQEDIVKYNEEFDKLTKKALSDIQTTNKISEQTEKELINFSKKIKQYFKTTLRPQALLDNTLINWYKITN